ncbi:DUF2892 domain-containing protein [Flavobacterium sp. Arc3]|uniref:YgaP family membrane protein n=1 Tax=Flavobacterium sp. Arc3 TaxID=3046686 RepID=UPI00352CAD95
MKKNLGTTDKIIRGTIAAIIALLYLADIISGTLAIVFGSIAVILFITSLISFCPMYSIFGHSSNSNNKSKTQL